MSKKTDKEKGENEEEEFLEESKESITLDDDDLDALEDYEDTSLISKEEHKDKVTIYRILHCMCFCIILFQIMFLLACIYAFFKDGWVFITIAASVMAFVPACNFNLLVILYIGVYVYRKSEKCKGGVHVMLKMFDFPKPKGSRIYKKIASKV